MSGYTPCACPDCMEIAISSDMAIPGFCHDCKLAGCDGGECQAPYSDDPDDPTDQGGEWLDANYSADDIAQEDKAADTFLRPSNCHVPAMYESDPIEAQS